MTAPVDDVDPHDASARTSLAWRRSGLSLVVTGFAIARGFGHLGVRSQPVVGLVIAGIGAGLWGLANLEARRRARSVQTDRPAATHRELAVFACATALAGVVALVVAWNL